MNRFECTESIPSPIKKASQRAGKLRACSRMLESYAIRSWRHWRKNPVYPGSGRGKAPFCATWLMGINNLLYDYFNA
jgi:hypothetical protein